MWPSESAHCSAKKPFSLFIQWKQVLAKRFSQDKRSHEEQVLQSVPTVTESLLRSHGTGYVDSYLQDRCYYAKLKRKREVGLGWQVNC